MKILTAQPGTGLSSPSNVLTAGLVALLLVGYGTDWKILFGNPKKPSAPARFGASETTVGAHRMRHLRQGYVPGSESVSEVADSRSTMSNAVEAGGKLD